MKIFKNNSQSGQILLVMLLIMIVGLTIGLFLLGRTTTDISLTTKISDSSRAFNAAEAGIEEAIRSTSSYIGTPGGPSPTPVLVDTGVTYSVAAAELGTSGVYPPTTQKEISLGQAFTVWLVGHNETTGELNESVRYGSDTIFLCYTTNSPAVPALGVTLLYKEGTVTKSSYKVYDSQSGRVTGTAETAQSNTGQCPADYNFYANVQISTDFSSSQLLSIIPLALRMRPLFAPSSIAAQPAAGFNLPKQGNDITSSGNVGEVTRRINVKKPFTVPPPFIDYVLYSTGNTSALTHN